MARKQPKNVPAGRIEKGPPRKAVPAIAAKPQGFAPAAPGLFVVRWTKFDLDGPWCLGASKPAKIVDLMRRIRDAEQLTPDEVFRLNGSLGVDYGDPANIPNAKAKRRLRDLRLMDETCISRLRIGGKARLYGFRRDPEFYAVFWDPEHDIWP